MDGCVDKFWRSKYDEYATCQRENRNALAQLTELRRNLHAAESLSDATEDCIKNATEALRKQQASLHSFLGCIPVEARMPEGAQSVIDQVLATPELLENILHFLRLHDALTAQQVCRSFFHAIQDSPRIQRKLGFLPDEECNFRVTLPVTLNNIYFFVDDYTEPGMQVTEDNHVSLSGDIFHGTRKLPKLGSRASTLLISQPPVKSLKFFADCCYDRYPLPSAQDPTHVIDSPTGVTIGQAISAARDLVAEHRLCPNASIASHDENGNVRCSLYLQAKVRLRDGDPRLEMKKQRREAQRVSTGRTQGLGVRLGPYVAAKQAARQRGEPIPTLEEFERLSGSGT